MYPTIPNHQFIHGFYIPPNEYREDDGVFAIIKDKDTDDVKLQLIQNPKYKLWVLKKPFWDIQDRLEDSPLSQLDEFVCEYRNLVPEISKRLGYKPGKFVQPRMLLSDPRVFGVDIDVPIRLKLDYMNSTPGLIKNLTIGAYDLETSVLGDNEIYCSSFVDWDRKQAWCHINARWFQPGPGSEERMVKMFHEKKAEAYKQMNDKAKKAFDYDKWEVHFVMCQTEKELILRTWQKIHESKVLFLGIWNSTFDIPKTIERCMFLQIDPKQIFCHPNVPDKWKYYKYMPDNKRHDHFTDRWDVMENTAYCYIYDAMCLYSRTRKVKGREASYALDVISRNLTGIGKIGLEDTGDHHLMQTKYKAEYCVYNVFDSILIVLNNAITNDIGGMIGSIGNSGIPELSRQTSSLVHQFYKYALDNRRVPGSCGGMSMRGPYDEVIGNVGGAVLDSNKLKAPGWSCIVEYPDGTWLRKLACDIDVTSFYPSMDIAGNMSRGTKLSTIIWVEGCPFTIDEIMSAESDKLKEARRKANAEYIDTLFGKIPYVSENTVSICSEYFGLGSYSEMLALYQATKQHALNTTKL